MLNTDPHRGSTFFRTLVAKLEECPPHTINRPIALLCLKSLMVGKPEEAELAPLIQKALDQTLQGEKTLESGALLEHIRRLEPVLINSIDNPFSPPASEAVRRLEILSDPAKGKNKISSLPGDRPAITASEFLDKARHVMRLDINGSDSAEDQELPPLSPTYLWVEDFVTGALRSTFEPAKGPRLLLLGPGGSRTDPLYALRFLDRLKEHGGCPGAMLVYEGATNSRFEQYYTKLREKSPHHIEINTGPEEDYDSLSNLGAQILFALHPGRFHRDLLPVFRDNVTSGGIALWQQDCVDVIANEEGYHRYLYAILKNFNESFEFLSIPLRSHRPHPMVTAFGNTFPIAILFLLRRR